MAAYWQPGLFFYQLRLFFFGHSILEVTQNAFLWHCGVGEDSPIWERGGQKTRIDFHFSSQDKGTSPINLFGLVQVHASQAV